MSKQQDQIVAAAEGKISEQIIGAAFAKPRGSQTAGSGGGPIVGEIGRQWAGKQRKGAEAAGIELGNPGAVAVTPTDLLTMSVKVSLMGKITAIEKVLSTVPLSDIESLEVKRAGMAGVMTITTTAGSFKLEGKAGDMKEFADSFERAKAAAG